VHAGTNRLLPELTIGEAHVVNGDEHLIVNLPLNLTRLAWIIALKIACLSC